MNLLPFSIDDVNAIVRLSQVFRYLSRPFTLDSRSWDVPNLGGHSRDATMIYIDRGLNRWQWLGKPVSITPYVILREQFAMGVLDALAGLDGRELRELLIRMRMVNRDDGPTLHSYSFAMGAVTYAIKQSYGDSGVRSFERFVEANAKKPSDCANPPPDLRSL